MPWEVLKKHALIANMFVPLYITCFGNVLRTHTVILLLGPHDVLQERLAWLTTDPTKVDHDNKLPRFAAATRADVLQQRHDAD